MSVKIRHPNHYSLLNWALLCPLPPPLVHTHCWDGPLRPRHSRFSPRRSKAGKRLGESHVRLWVKRGIGSQQGRGRHVQVQQVRRLTRLEDSPDHMSPYWKSGFYYQNWDHFVLFLDWNTLVSHFHPQNNLKYHGVIFQICSLFHTLVWLAVELAVHETYRSLPEPMRLWYYLAA